MMYEFGQLAGCTAIAYTSHFQSFLSSNLDYNFHEFFSEVVFHAQYYMGNVKLYEARQLFGFLGYVTATNGYLSVTLNARHWKFTLDEFLEVLGSGTLTSTVYGFRRALETSFSFEELRDKFVTAEALAPAYYTIVDLHDNKAVIVTRDLKQVNTTESLNQTSWYLVQTNLDRNMRDSRRTAAETKLATYDKNDDQLGQKIVTEVLSKKPNFNIIPDMKEKGVVKVRTISTSYHDPKDQSFRVLVWRLKPELDQLSQIKQVSIDL